MDKIISLTNIEVSLHKIEVSLQKTGVSLHLGCEGVVLTFLKIYFCGVGN